MKNTRKPTAIGKTAAKILEHMQRRHGRYGATVATGRGPEGGNIVREGAREFAACEELVRTGHAVLVDRRHFTLSQQGYGIFCCEITIRLPERNT